MKAKVIRVRDDSTLQIPKGWHTELVKGYRYQVRNGFRAEPCPGEAHSNAYIDNCSHCAPNWGVVAVQDD